MLGFGKKPEPPPRVEPRKVHYTKSGYWVSASEILRGPNAQKMLKDLQENPLVPPRSAAQQTSSAQQTKG